MKNRQMSVFLAAALVAAAAFAQERAESDDPSEASDLNFKDTPVEMVFEVYGKLVEKTVLKDPQAPSANITLQSRPGQRLTKEEQIEAIEVVLEMNGVHFEPYGEKFVRAVARKDIPKEGVPLYLDPEDPAIKDVPMGRVISVMLPFKNISAQEEAQKALEGFKSNTGLLQVFERTNSILVTDTRQNINRMLEIARTIDIATPVLENVFVRQIKNASATDIKTALEQIVTESQKELEKNGKGANSQQNRTVSAPQPTTLLRRPGANNPQPAAPANVESLVTSVSDADRGMIRGKVLILADERSNKLIIITMKSNMDFFDKVIEQLDVETTPDVKVEVIRLKYADAEDVSDMINDLIGNASSSKSSSGGNQNPTARQGGSANLTRGNSPTAVNANRKSANQRAGESKVGELSKDNVTVLADKRINGLVVMARTEDMPTLHEIIDSMDVRLSQVLIETVIIEVALGDGIDTGIDWISRGKDSRPQAITDSVGNKYYYAQNGDEINYNRMLRSGESYTDSEGETWTASAIAASTMATVRDGFVNSLAGGASYAMGGGSFGGTSAVSAMSNMVTNFVNSGFNAVFKSDKLNLGAILHAVKTDSRSKYIASPVVMTVDNKEATIEATEMRYLFKGYQYSGSTYNGTPVPDYEQKEIGITIKVTPKINPNGTVMLTVEEEYSQEGSGQMVDGETQATTVTRKMSADIVLENNMTVVFGGLTSTHVKESESGIPILKDIPWIGKWLFSSHVRDEARSELLVFMTPYVLDDAESAQAEAMRRKDALSDVRPWDDHGWSTSALADPVAKKEKLRRLKEVAKKQDEERQTRLAIEKWKMDRAKALEKMGAEERKFWIEQHKDELEKEEKEKFDKFVKEQKDLKDLAASIRSNRMERAEAAIKEAEAEERAPEGAPAKPAPEKPEPAKSEPANLLSELEAGGGGAK